MMPAEEAVLPVFHDRRRGGVRQLLRSRQGIAAVETALVAPIYIFAVVAVFQIVSNFFMQGVLDYATRIAVRQVQVGTAQVNATPQDFIRNLIAPNLFGLMSADKVMVDVQKPPSGFGSSFQGVPAVLAQGSFSFCYGQPYDPMLIHVIYASPLFMPAWFLDGARIFKNQSVWPLVSTAAFYDEPFVAPPGGYANPC